MKNGVERTPKNNIMTKMKKKKKKEQRMNSKSIQAKRKLRNRTKINQRASGSLAIGEEMSGKSEDSKNNIGTK